MCDVYVGYLVKHGLRNAGLLYGDPDRLLRHALRHLHLPLVREDLSYHITSHHIIRTISMVVIIVMVHQPEHSKGITQGTRGGQRKEKGGG